jgi:hypothetical protein
MTPNKMHEYQNFTYLVNKEPSYSNSWQYSGGSRLESHEYSLSPEPISENTDLPDSDGFDVEQLFRDKIIFQRLSTGQLFYLIKERDDIRDHNIDSIRRRLSYCHENLSRLNMARRYSMEPQINLRKTDGLQRLLFDLEKQERNEVVTAWRDTLRIKLSLPGMLKEYQNLKRQGSLLEDGQ